MSAIGDYIHYTAYGYLAFGTSPMTSNKKNYKMDFKSAKKIQQQKNQTSLKALRQVTLTQTERQEIENQLESLMKPSGNKEEQDFTNRLWEDLKTIFSQEFNTAILDIQRETAQISKITSQSVANQVKKIQDKNRTEKGWVGAKTILDRVSIFNSIINNLSSSTSYKEKLQEQLKKIYTEIEKMMGIAEGAISKTGYPALQKLMPVKLKNGKTNTFNWISAQNTVAEINKMVKLVNGVVNVAKGTLFQMMIAVSPLIGKNYSMEQLQQAIQTVIGGEKSSVTFDSRIFSDKINMKNILSKGYRQKNQYLYESVLESQNKIDVILTWNDKKLNVSAKNLNFSGKDASPYVHLVSGASLLALISTMDTNFVNHYLNLFSLHRRNVYKENGYEEKIDTRFKYLPQAHAAKTIVAESLLISAFIGYKQEDKANIFIVNDNTTGRVKVYNIIDLIERLMFFNDNEIESFISIKPSLDFLYFNNIFNIGGETARLESLLNEVHGNKISVAFKKNVLTEMY